MCVSEHVSLKMVHSIELTFNMCITGCCRTNPIDFAQCMIYSFFYRSTKSNSYALWLVESNYYNCM